MSKDKPKNARHLDPIEKFLIDIIENKNKSSSYLHYEQRYKQFIEQHPERKEEYADLHPKFFQSADKTSINVNAYALAWAIKHPEYNTIENHLVLPPKTASLDVKGEIQFHEPQKELSKKYYNALNATSQQIQALKPMAQYNSVMQEEMDKLYNQSKYRRESKTIEEQAQQIQDSKSRILSDLTINAVAEQARQQAQQAALLPAAPRRMRLTEPKKTYTGGIKLEMKGTTEANDVQNKKSLLAETLRQNPALLQGTQLLSQALASNQRTASSPAQTPKTQLASPKKGWLFWK